MHIQMPANGLAEARAGYFIKTFLFSMYFNSKNGQFYPNLGSNYISFRKVVFMAVIMDHKKSTAIKNMQFTETLFSIIL